jgi:VCBS repeat-containing protein
LANDDDVEGDALTALLVDSPEHGTLSLNPDGSFTYTPDPNFNGTDMFSYRASDGAADSLVAAVTITVVAVEDPFDLVLPAEFSDPENIPSRLVGQAIDFTALVNDADNEQYTFFLDLEESGIPNGTALPTIDLSSGQFQWTPTAAGRFTIRVIAVSDDGEADQETFVIDILPE